MKKLTHKELKRCLNYNPETGVFIWLAKTTPSAHRIKIGAVAANANVSGHLQVVIHKKAYMAHRLAWFYVTKAWPSKDLDHKNGIPDDNRWENLREATRSQNIMNAKKRSDGLSPLKGVAFYKKLNRYAGKIKKDGKHYYLGLFDTPEEAHAAYMAKAKELFGEFARA